MTAAGHTQRSFDETISSAGAAARTVIEGWYRRLGFPPCYDDAFLAALASVDIDTNATPESYDSSCEDGVKNLIYYLYFCERTAALYAAQGWPESILLDTLKDLVLWTNVWSEVKGRLYLGELPWLFKHLTGRLFRIGRLQYCPSASGVDIPSHGVRRGDAVIEIHIPRDGRMTPEQVRASVEQAKAFFALHRPELSGVPFTCQSWLLDETLRDYLPEGSNILCFGDMFDRIHAKDNNALLHYLFRWDTKEDNLADAVATSGFAARVKEAVLHGVQFHITLGVYRSQG